MHHVIWLGRMAWRDSRGNRRRLLLAIAAITVGIAAFVAITAFDHTVRTAVQAQAKAVLGADLMLSSRQPFTPETEALLATLGGEQAREISCNSMASFPTSGTFRLVQVRALQGDFPYYGTLETVPPVATAALRTGWQALVDAGLLLQFDAHLGDPIKIGTQTLTIAGGLHKIPGEAMTAGLISPRVYIPMDALLQADLLQKGSVVTYKVYIKLPPEGDAEALLESLRTHLITYHLKGETANQRAASLGHTMTNLSHFLNLIGFLAILLGGLGVASALHVYITAKLPTVALLRCLGARPWQPLAMYVLQALGLGALGALLGGLAGVALQYWLPRLLQEFLPVTLPGTIAWTVVGRGLLGALWMVLLFAMMPLLTVRQIAPLAALRQAYAPLRPGRRDPWLWTVVLLIVGSIGAFALTHSARWTHGLLFCAGLAAALGLLAAVGILLMALVRRWRLPAWPYVWRQGIANLHRPQNQTLVMIVALGFGTFLLLTLYLTQQTLLRQGALAEQADQPNVIFFDIQSDQRQAVAALVHAHGLTVQQQVPLVPMRLAALRGKSTEAWRAETGKPIPEWALLWEYRATYRPHLLDSETVRAGVWYDRAASADAVVPISLEEELAHTLNATLGDTLVFDVQGVPITTQVTSTRRVDWQRLQPNVFVLFPTGVLEAAPQFHVLVARAPSPQGLAAIQRAVVQQFPNVSAIDLTVLLQTLNTLVQKITFAIRFMAFFTIAAGLLVLASAVLSSRAQRLRESILLRTLGASRQQIRHILGLEYLCLGGLAALTGGLLAVLASWALATFLFALPFVITPIPLLVALLLVSVLTVVTGLYGSRGITTQPPLQVLQRET